LRILILGDDVLDVVVVAEYCDVDDDDAQSSEDMQSLRIQAKEDDSTAGEYESSFDDDDGDETLAFEMPDDDYGKATVADEKGSASERTY
jgi:hypothetical protein